MSEMVKENQVAIPPPTADVLFKNLLIPVLYSSTPSYSSVIPFHTVHSSLLINVIYRNETMSSLHNERLAYYVV